MIRSPHFSRLNGLNGLNRGNSSDQMLERREELGRTLAVVLNKRSFKESGFLVDLFTLEYGRITLLTRGRANPKRPLHHLELFSYSDWHLKEGRVFHFAHEVDLLYTFSLKGREIWTAYYLNELLLRLMPKHQPAPELFQVYQEVLAALAEDVEEISPYLRHFERSLLAYLGILPDLFYDAAGDPINSQKSYYLSHEEGVLPIEFPGTFKISGEVILKIAEEETLVGEEALIYRNMMRYLLAPLIGDKPLQSRIWMQRLYRKR